MKFKNQSPLGALEIPALGRIVDRDEEFDVPAAIAPLLAGQSANYEPVDDEAIALVAEMSKPAAETEPGEPDEPVVDATSTKPARKTSTDPAPAASATDGKDGDK
ncbi:hypothetical protein BKA24_001689 [Microbacterium marinum]|uniref:Uncharacterized protein n=1 Tax=Microbacterium marinum TaxID=421115 RepID=A0A7W7FJ21_9MICO|nr:hypothetical protein [Microbacterium marinum]MBB4666980.1 hypothetical protein [Microbacterium marinum]